MNLFSPAKINLMLCVHDRRADGFHNLTSLVLPLDYGDRLRICKVEGKDQLHCDATDVPTGEGNLIMQAADAFRKAIANDVYFSFELDKVIPMQAGLGGGSSNAAVALRGMNQLLGEPLNQTSLLDIAATIGSDCPFFINANPALISSKGEVITALEPKLLEQIKSQKWLLFRPDFGVDTAWAYARFAANATRNYESSIDAHKRLAEFTKTGNWETLMVNSLERPVCEKYIPIDVLLETLRKQGVDCMLSGSGSCCIARVTSNAQRKKLTEMIQGAWGESVFLVETLVCDLETEGD
tara:strand:+ start:455 stop:1342 length:888 start_codon:yes stop_codon:yes gene_type:complete